MIACVSAVAIVSCANERPARVALPAATAADVVDGAAPMKGRIEPIEIRRVIRAAIPEFLSCYRAELAKTPAARGTVATRFIIREDGLVDHVYSESVDAMLPQAMADCVANVYRRMRFPPGSGRSLVKYPLSFEAD